MSNYEYNKKYAEKWKKDKSKQISITLKLTD